MIYIIYYDDVTQRFSFFLPPFFANKKCRSVVPNPPSSLKHNTHTHTHKSVSRSRSLAVQPAIVGDCGYASATLDAASTGTISNDYNDGRRRGDQLYDTTTVYNICLI